MRFPVLGSLLLSPFAFPRFSEHSLKGGDIRQSCVYFSASLHLVFVINGNKPRIRDFLRFVRIYFYCRRSIFFCLCLCVFVFFTLPGLGVPFPKRWAFFFGFKWKHCRSIDRWHNVIKLKQQTIAKLSHQGYGLANEEEKMAYTYYLFREKAIHKFLYS